MCDLPQRFIQSRGSELNTSEAMAMITDMAVLGVSGFSFGGGEPLMRPDIFELIAHAKKEKMLVHLNTNGFLLDEAAVGSVVNAGVDTLNVSIDGADAATHDNMRGLPGSFEKATAGLRRLSAFRRRTGADIRFKIACVLDETNIDQARRYLNLAKDIGVDCVEFIPQQPIFDSTADWEKRFDEDFLRRLDIFRNEIRSLSAECRMPVENSDRHIALFRDSFCRRPFPVQCYAAYATCIVDAVGDVFPCVPFVNLKKPAGNIRRVPLRKLWFSNEYNKQRARALSCRLCYLNCQAELNLLFNNKANNNRGK